MYIYAEIKYQLQMCTLQFNVLKLMNLKIRKKNVKFTQLQQDIISTKYKVI